MEKNSFSCPVPKDQQPMHEYTNLKNSIFFFWTTEDLRSYLSKVVILILNCMILGIFLSVNNIFETNLINHIVSISLIVDSCIILFLIRIYLGWDYIYNRLKNATVSYEESGWYDGQIWIKTPEMLIQDRLVADYILIPILKRIKITLTLLIVYFLVGLWNTY
jgi:hypothetical protein